MTLTFELAHFSVREDDEEALIADRPAMVSALRDAFPGALAAWLAKQDDGTWLDVILWRWCTSGSSRSSAATDASNHDGRRVLAASSRGIVTSRPRS
jgi:hypothetical protein